MVYMYDGILLPTGIRIDRITDDKRSRLCKLTII